MLSTQTYNDSKYIFTEVQKLLDTVERYSGFIQGPFIRTFILGILTKDFEKCTLQDSCNIHFKTKENLSNFLTRNTSVIRKIPSEKDGIDALGNEYMKYMLIDDFDDRILTLKFTWGDNNTHWDIVNHQTIYMSKKIHSVNISSSILYSDVRNNIIRLTKRAFDILIGEQVGSNYPIKRFAKKYVGKVRIFYEDVEYVCVRFDKTIIREGEEFDEFTLIKLSEHGANHEKRICDGHSYVFDAATGECEKVFHYSVQKDIPDSGVSFAKDVVADGLKTGETDILAKAKVYVMDRLIADGCNPKGRIYVSDISDVSYICAYNDRHNPANPSYDAILDIVKNAKNIEAAREYMKRAIPKKYTPKDISIISDDLILQAYNERHTSNVTMTLIIQKLEEHHDLYLLHRYG